MSWLETSQIRSRDRQATYSRLCYNQLNSQVVASSLSGIRARTFTDESADDSENEMRAEASVNQITLLGRVGKDPEERGTSQTSSLVLFPLATNSSYNRSDGVRVTRTEWHRICVGLPWLKENIALNLRKGDRVYLHGEVRYDEFNDPTTHAKVRATSIFANSIINLTKKFQEESTD